MIKSQTIAIIDESFRSMIKSQNYEKYVFTIINRSEKIFYNLKFTEIHDQSHGESDFIDNKEQLYDAKLLFDTKQGALIGASKNEITAWIYAMLNEKSEFSKCIQSRDLSFVVNTKLYSIMKKRLFIRRV